MAQAVSRPATPGIPKAKITPPVSVTAEEPVVVSRPPSVLGNRAQMEAERIARQKAREAQNGSSQPNSSATPTIAASKPPASSSGPKIATMSDLQSRNAEAGPSSSSGPVRSGNPVKSFQTTHHPLQSRGPFPTDAAGEYYLDGEMRHNALSIGNPSDAPTFSPQQVVGKVSGVRASWSKSDRSRRMKLPC